MSCMKSRNIWHLVEQVRQKSRAFFPQYLQGNDVSSRDSCFPAKATYAKYTKARCHGGLLSTICVNFARGGRNWEQNGASTSKTTNPDAICQIPATMHMGLIVTQHQTPKNIATETDIQSLFLKKKLILASNRFGYVAFFAQPRVTHKS